jgi:hypothetical protein
MRRVLLPGVTTLVRPVASRRDAATQRLWETLQQLLDDEQRGALDGLLEVPEGHRNSQLDKLRRPPTRVSGPAMVDALQRVSEILGRCSFRTPDLALGGLRSLRDPAAPDEDESI